MLYHQLTLNNEFWNPWLLFGLMFICDVAFIGVGVVTGTKGTAAVADLHGVLYTVGDF